MAVGRMVLGAVSHDEALGRVSCGAALLWMMCQPHLDVEGRMIGHPALVRALVMPLRAEVTDQMVGEWLHELSVARNGNQPLVQWYEAEGGDGVVRRWLSFPGFGASQPNLRPDREAPSRVPCPPEVEAAQLDLLPSAIRGEPAGVGSEDGPTPDQLRSSPPRSRSRSRSRSDIHGGSVEEVEADFDALWPLYPKRSGGNPRDPARQAYLARRREGVSADALRLAVEKYAATVRRNGSEGTAYVMQARTFFGPNKRWADDYGTPATATSRGRVDDYAGGVDDSGKGKARRLEQEG